MSYRNLSFFLALFLGPQLFAAHLIPVNLADLASSSARIFEGRCLRIEQTTVPSKGGKVAIPAATYTFQVADNLKGDASSTITLTPLGEPAAGQTFLISPKDLNLPEYQIGQTYLLFFAKQGVTGLTSPVGLSQGVFSIEGERAINLNDTNRILQGMEQTLAASRFKSLAAKTENGFSKSLLKDLVRDLLSGKLAIHNQEDK